MFSSHYIVLLAQPINMTKGKKELLVVYTVMTLSIVDIFGTSSCCPPGLREFSYTDKQVKFGGDQPDIHGCPP